MTQFQIGTTYKMTSACDHECTWQYTVTARTAQTVTLTDGRETIKCRIDKGLSSYRGAEAVRPFGRYSMAPILSADNAA